MSNLKNLALLALCVAMPLMVMADCTDTEHFNKWCTANPAGNCPNGVGCANGEKFSNHKGDFGNDLHSPDNYAVIAFGSWTPCTTTWGCFTGADPNTGLAVCLTDIQNPNTVDQLQYTTLECEGGA